MEQIVFSRHTPASCPAYKDYYIQDRAIGNNIYGHEAYEYALFRKCHFRAVRQFRTRKQAYKYVSGITGLSDWDVRMGSGSIIVNDRELLGVRHGGKLYRIEKRTRTVSVRPESDDQLTGWFTSYNECLSAAKAFIQDKEAQA